MGEMVKKLKDSPKKHKIQTTGGASKNFPGRGENGGTLTNWNPEGHGPHSGNTVLAHELTHALQNDENRRDTSDQDGNGVPDNEDEAVEMENEFKDATGEGNKRKDYNDDGKSGCGC